MGPLVVVLALTCIQLASAVNQSIVCRHWSSYYTIKSLNPDCYYNPDTTASFPEIVTSHGYPVEIYEVTTEDGYILTVFRIPHGKNSTGGEPGDPIFILHGFLTSSMFFIFRNTTSLAFILADQGYDVWLGNFRGVRYSDRNLYMNQYQRKFWDFSFNEVGRYDLPPMLNLVSNVTGKRMYYIGYSMGTTSWYIYSSLFPDVAQSKVRFAISLAPIAILKYITTPTRYIFPAWPIIEIIWSSVTNGAFIRRRSFTALASLVCMPYPFQMKFCNIFISLVFGYDPDQLSPELEPILYLNLFDACSIKSFTHYVQLYFSGDFRNYDYGRKNKEIYGTKEPPLYPISNMTVPNYFIGANNDLVGTPKNVRTFYDLLPERARPFGIYTIPYEKFTHVDIGAATNAKPLLYDHVVEVLQKYGPSYP